MALPIPYKAWGDNTLAFSFSPTLSNFSWSVAGVVYTSSQPKAQVNTALTFTAAATVPPNAGRRIVTYNWDFGDGTKGYGSVVAHTFKLANQFVRVRCCIIDNFGVQICVGQQIYVT